MMLLRLLLVSFAVALVRGSYDDHPQKTCLPREETVTLTATSVEASSDLVTEYDMEMGLRSVEVTSVILLPSTLVETRTLTHFSGPEVDTVTSLVTKTFLAKEFATSSATVASTTTSLVAATQVEVRELTVTQTAVVDHTVTQTVSVREEETAFRTVTVTHQVTAFQTETEVSNFYVTERGLETVTEYATDVVTSFAVKTVEATVTFTEKEYVTKCHEPKITYEH